MALRQRIRQFIGLFFVLVFCFAANSAFALEQLQNTSFDTNIDGWNQINRINGANGTTATFSNNNGNLQIEIRNTGNNNTNMDGLAYQAFTTPTTATNVKISWGTVTLTHL